ncbi:Rac guanine nucleotide exchange factor gxcJJ, partial [Acrasis kona]
PFLKTYTTYTNSFNTTCELLRDLRRKNKPLDEFLTEQIRNPKSATHPLESLLIMPVQRIPRYNLLINELLKHTSAYHRDYENLKNALVQLKEVTNHVNSRIREYEENQLLNQIGSGLKWDAGKLILPHRKIKFLLCDHKSGWVSMVSKKTKESLPTLMVVLSDLVLIVSGDYMDNVQDSFEYNRVDWSKLKIVKWFWISLPKDLRSDEDIEVKTDVNLEDSPSSSPSVSSPTTAAVAEPVLPTSPSTSSSDISPTSSDAFSTPNQIDLPSPIDVSVVPEQAPVQAAPASPRNLWKKKNITSRFFFPWMFDMNEDDDPKHAFQFVTEDDIYVMAFKTNEDKWKCMVQIFNALESAVKVDPQCTNYYAIMKDYQNDALENEAIQQKKVKLRRKTVISSSDLPRALIFRKKMEQKLQFLVTPDRIQQVKHFDTSNCVGVCVATATFRNANPTKHQINFYRGDVFLIFEKLSQSGKWWLVKKIGFNNCPDRYKMLTSSQLPQKYFELRQLQLDQQRRSKKLTTRPTLLKPVNKHMVKVNNITKDDMKDAVDRLDLVKLIESKHQEVSPTTTETRSFTLPEPRERRSLFVKVPVIQTRDISEDDKFLKSLINLYDERDEVGVVASYFMSETSKGLSLKILDLAERRDEMEIRKTRNYMVKKRDVKKSPSDVTTSVPVTTEKRSKSLFGKK